MINDRPPRDGSPPSAGFQNVTEHCVTRDIHFPGRNVDVTGRDFPTEGHSQSSSVAPQHGYSLSMNTSGLDPTRPSSEGETVGNTARPIVSQRFCSRSPRINNSMICGRDLRSMRPPAHSTITPRYLMVLKVVNLKLGNVRMPLLPDCRGRPLSCPLMLRFTRAARMTW